MSSTGTVEYRGASQRAIEHHYDVGNEFWELWLDPTMTYSCAMWEEGDTLESAQLRKLDWLLDNARARPGGRLLDIGCGWGAALRRAVERGAAEAVGITLSPKQHELITARRDPDIEVQVVGWAEYESAEPFGSIISAGAFEHFARLGLSREEKVASYRQFFERCHGLLRPGGWMTLQTIAKGDVALDGIGVRDLITIAQAFPQSDLPYPSEVVEAIQGRFELVALRNDRLHYIRTCQAWLERLDAHADEAVAVAGEEVTTFYRRYLKACIRQFQRNHAGLLRFILHRVEESTPFRLGAPS